MYSVIHWLIQQRLRISQLLCVVVIVGISVLAWAQKVPTSKPDAKSKSTVYAFEAEDLMGKGKGPNNVFLKVGKMKNRKLLEMRPNFRPELKNSLRLVK